MYCLYLLSGCKNRVVVTETTWPAKPKIITIWSPTENVRLPLFEDIAFLLKHFTNILLLKNIISTFSTLSLSSNSKFSCLGCLAVFPKWDPIPKKPGNNPDSYHSHIQHERMKPFILSSLFSYSHFGLDPTPFLLLPSKAFQFKGIFYQNLAILAHPDTAPSTNRKYKEQSLSPHGGWHVHVTTPASIAKLNRPSI